MTCIIANQNSSKKARPCSHWVRTRVKRVTSETWNLFFSILTFSFSHFSTFLYLVHTIHSFWSPLAYCISHLTLSAQKSDRKQTMTTNIINYKLNYRKQETTTTKTLFHLLLPIILTPQNQRQPLTTIICIRISVSFF